MDSYFRAPVYRLQQILFHSTTIVKHLTQMSLRTSPSQLSSPTKPPKSILILPFELVVLPSPPNRFRIILCHSFSNHFQIHLNVPLNKPCVIVRIKIQRILILSPATSTVTALLHILKPCSARMTIK